jgi:hypothetical protein
MVELIAGYLEIRVIAHGVMSTLILSKSKFAREERYTRYHDNIT